ncbi:MAG: hypothetical protein V1676_00270 [Candidatus Diapherotrites archaeon]
MAIIDVSALRLNLHIGSLNITLDLGNKKTRRNLSKLSFFAGLCVLLAGVLFYNSIPAPFSTGIILAGAMLVAASNLLFG